MLKVAHSRRNDNLPFGGQVILLYASFSPLVVIQMFSSTIYLKKEAFQIRIM